MDLDPSEWDDGLDSAAGAACFESEDTQHVELLQLRVNIGHVAIDEASQTTTGIDELVRKESCSQSSGSTQPAVDPGNAFDIRNDD